MQYRQDCHAHMLLYVSGVNYNLYEVFGTTLLLIILRFGK